MSAIHFVGPQPAMLDSARQEVAANLAVTASGASSVYTGFGLAEITVTINVTGAVSGAGASLTLNVQEIDPGDLATALATSSATAITTTLTTRTVKLRLLYGDAVKVTWTVAGSTPNFAGVYITLSANAALPTAAAQEHVLAASPHAVRLSTGAAFYDAPSSAQLPATLGQKAMAASLAVVIASDQSALSVSVSAALPAGANAIGKLAANAGVNIGQVDLATTPTTNLATIAADTTFLRSYNPASAQLPASLGQKAMAASTSVVVASDQGPLPISAASLPLPSGAAAEHATAASPHSVRLSTGAAFYDAPIAAQLPASLGQKAMAASAAVVIASDQSVVPVSLPTIPTANLATIAADTTFLRSYNPASAQLPASLGQKAMAASTSIVVASDQGSVPTSSPETTAAGTISALSGAVQIALAGQNYVMAVITVGSFVGTLQPQFGDTSLIWAGQWVDGQTLVKSGSDVGPAGTLLRFFYVPPGTGVVGVVASAWSSGSCTVTLRAARSEGNYKNISAWFGSVAPTVGQKGMASSLPMVIASDQSAVPVSLPTTPTANLATMAAAVGPATTAGSTNVPASLTSVTILAANANRAGATIYNDSSSQLTLKKGASASSTSLLTKVAAFGTYELYPPRYTGIITGFWGAATGNARVTEDTP